MWLLPKLWRDVERNFEEEGKGAGGWAPLSTAYAKWKTRRYPGKPILQREGRLLNSLRPSNDGRSIGRDGILEISRTGMAYGTAVLYGKFHQDGGKKGRPPQRRFLFLFAGSSETLGRMLHAYGVSMAKRAGLRTQGALQASAGLVPITGGPGGSTL